MRTSAVQIPSRQLAKVPSDWQTPNVTGVFPSWHPSADPQISGQSPYPSPYGSQSAMYPIQSVDSPSYGSRQAQCIQDIPLPRLRPHLRIHL